jgi:hypothetical protein
MDDRLLDVSALNSVASFGYMEDEKSKTWDEVQRKSSFDARVNFNQTHIEGSKFLDLEQLLDSKRIWQSKLDSAKEDEDGLGLDGPPVIDEDGPYSFMPLPTEA